MQCDKVHPLDLQENIFENTADEPASSGEIHEFQYYSNTLKHSDQVERINIQNENLKKCTSIKSLQEVLMECQSDSPTSISSCYNYYLEEDDSEVTV